MHSHSLVRGRNALLALLLTATVGCNVQTVMAGGAADSATAKPVAAAKPDALATLGRMMFFDPSLSASGKQSCATCHNPAFAYAPPNDLPVQLGGPHLKQQGMRATPSLMYALDHTPAWREKHPSHFPEYKKDLDSPPLGGIGWDGRFKTLADQAAFPLLASNEMDNTSAEDILRKIHKAPYAEAFRKQFGETTFADPAAALAAAGRALEEFETKDPSFHPYSSKYDAVLDGKATLTPQEQHGLDLYNDNKRGNCGPCHANKIAKDGSRPLFTNFEFTALAVPRNMQIVANRDPKFYDLGLCGPLRKDQADKPSYCGRFKTPTLRNVATRKVFFHNGKYRTLREVLEFYVQRDTNPYKFYPSRKGKLQRFNDIPEKYWMNVNFFDPPLTKHMGDQPAWNDKEIDDVIAFLETLTDGYKPQ